MSSTSGLHGARKRTKTWKLRGAGSGHEVVLWNPSGRDQATGHGVRKVMLSTTGERWAWAVGYLSGRAICVCQVILAHSYPLNRSPYTTAQEAASHDTLPSDEYLLHRILHGVPEGTPDIPPMHAFPMDSNLDVMGARKCTTKPCKYIVRFNRTVSSGL